jgi:hypothetical protein
VESVLGGVEKNSLAAHITHLGMGARVSVPE